MKKETLLIATLALLVFLTNSIIAYAEDDHVTLNKMIIQRPIQLTIPGSEAEEDTTPRSEAEDYVRWDGYVKSISTPNYCHCAASIAISGGSGQKRSVFVSSDDISPADKKKALFCNILLNVMGTQKKVVLLVAPESGNENHAKLKYIATQ